MTIYDQYAADVRDGKILVCKFVKQAVERYYGLFEREDIVFKAHLVDRVINFVGMLKHYTGRHAGKPFTLLPWQQFVIACV